VSIDAARTLVQGVGQLPVIPDQADRLLRVASQGDTDISELLVIVESDSVLSAMVLRLVNSAAFGLRNRVTSLGQAVVLLGLTHVRSLAMAASMASLFSGKGGAAKAKWRHSFAVGSASRSLAMSCGLKGYEEEAFAVGMLHDLGELVIDSCFGAVNREIDRAAELDQLPRLAAERLKLGADHAQIGAALAEHWRIPDHLVEAITHHHDAAIGPEDVPIMNIDDLPVLTRLLIAGEAVYRAYVDQAYPMVSGDPIELIGGLGARDPEAIAKRTRDDVVRHLLAAELSGGRR